MDEYIILTILGISLLKGIIRSMNLPLTHNRREHQRSVAKHMENDLQNQLHCLDIKKIMKVSKVLLGHTSSYLLQNERYHRYRTSRNLKRVCRVSAPRAASLVGKWLESLGILSKLSFREVFDSWYFLTLLGKVKTQSFCPLSLPTEKVWSFSDEPEEYWVASEVLMSPQKFL